MTPYIPVHKIALDLQDINTRVTFWLDATDPSGALKYRLEAKHSIRHLGKVLLTLDELPAPRSRPHYSQPTAFHSQSKAQQLGNATRILIFN